MATNLDGFKRGWDNFMQDKAISSFEDKMVCGVYVHACPFEFNGGRVGFYIVTLFSLRSL